MIILTIAVAVGALLFGASTFHGLKTGKIRAFGNVYADRTKEPDWFWGWVIINGASAVGCVFALCLSIAVVLFGRP